MFATRHYLTQRTTLDQTIPFDPAKGHQEMPDGLTVQPGYYKGFVYDQETQSVSYCALDFTQPGLYQIFIPMNEGPNGSIGNIYYKIVASTALGLASAVASLHAFGTLDDAMPLSQQLIKIQNSPLSIECGQSANVLVSLAQSAGYEARVAAMLTNEIPNGFNDGHTIAEIKVNGKWVAFDTSMNFVMSASGDTTALLSIADACEGIWTGTTEFYEIAPFQFDAQPTIAGQWNQFGWCMADALYDTAERTKGMQKLYRIPIVLDADGHFYFYLPVGAEQQLQYALSLGYRQMTKDAFMAHFYPEA